MRDLSRSRAVLIGTWDYTHLPPIPAARHSLDRMRDLLTGDLCGWPADRVSVIANRPKPGDLHDDLIELFADTDGGSVALFYYVGHGQPDDRDRLCLTLADSRTEARRRASTSLRFDDVREALRGCDAGTKILILDCCFAGLATRPQHTLSSGSMLDMTRGTGAYTMAASSAYLPAWFETDPGLTRPQTYFTKYLADVVEGGIPGEPAELPVDRIYAEVADRLVRDGRPEPTNTARHAAGRFVFARNVRPAQPATDQPAEIQALRERLAVVEAREAELLRRYRDNEKRLHALQAAAQAGDLSEEDRQRILRQQDVTERAVDESAQASVAAYDERRRTSAALEQATGQVDEDPPSGAWTGMDVGGLERAARTRRVVEVRDAIGILAGAGMDGQVQAILLAAGGRPVGDVAELAVLLSASGRRPDAITMLRLAAHRPVGDVADLAKALRTRDAGHQPPPFPRSWSATRDHGDLRTYFDGIEQARPLSETLLVPAARRAVPDVVELSGVMRAAGNPDATYLLHVAGWQRPVPELIELAGALRAAGRDDDADLMLKRAGARPMDVLIPLITAAGEAGPPHADLRAVLDGVPPLSAMFARHVTKALGRTSFPAGEWTPPVKPEGRFGLDEPASPRTEIALMVLQFCCYGPVAFLLGIALAQRNAVPQLSPWRWAFGAVSLVVLGYGVLAVQAGINTYLSDHEPEWGSRAGTMVRKVTRWVLWIPIAAGLLAVGWVYGPALGLESLGGTLRDWLVWRF